MEKKLNGTFHTRCGLFSLESFKIFCNFNEQHDSLGNTLLGSRSLNFSVSNGLSNCSEARDFRKAIGVQFTLVGALSLCVNYIRQYKLY